MDQDADGAVPEFIYGSIYRRVAVELPNILHEQSSSGVGELPSLHDAQMLCSSVTSLLSAGLQAGHGQTN